MPNLSPHICVFAVLSLAGFGLVACGGGGSSSSIVVTPPTGGGGGGSTGPTWTQNVFQAAGNFKNRCAVPRSGIDPATNQSYPDVAGSTLYENHWLRSWSNNTYLWYNEIVDRDPQAYSDRLEYFDTLKTEAITGSGNEKDRFHFTYDTDEYYQLTSSGASAGFGMRVRLIATRPPREAVVGYVEPNSPAETAGIERGYKLTHIDGEALIDGDADVLNAGLSPDSASEQHSFTFEKLDGTPVDITMTSAIVTAAPVNVAKTMDIGSKKIGYIHFTTFGTSIAEEAIVDAFSTLQADNVDDLVLDLRYNGGGFLSIASELGYMIAGDQTQGKNFETLTFNDKHPTVDPVTGETITPTPFYSTARGFSVSEGTALPTLNLDRVFILSTGSTCSASEALINGLRGIDVDVILVGSNTCGKPYGFYGTDNCGVTYFTIQLKGVNNKNFGDYADGFAPANEADAPGVTVTGCAAFDDFTKPLGDMNESSLSTALEYASTGTCPTPPASASSGTKGVASAAYAKRVSWDNLDQNSHQLDRYQLRTFLEQTLIRSDPPQMSETSLEKRQD